MDVKCWSDMGNGRELQQHFFGAGDVVKDWVAFFKEETPAAENTLSCVGAELMGEVFMITVYKYE